MSAFLKKTTDPECSVAQSGRLKLWVYLTLSAFATTIFLLFTFMITMVPGIYPNEKLWMLSIEGGFVVASLLAGIVRGGANKANIAKTPLGASVAVVLVVELTVCVISIYQVVASTVH